MAEDAEQESKTVDASARRLNAAFEEGQVPVSRDLAAWASLAGGVAAMVAMAPTLESRLKDLIQATVEGFDHPHFERLPTLILPIVPPLVLPIAVAALLGLVVGLAQTQGNIWPELLAPDPSRLFNYQRLGRIFSKDFLIDLGLALVKALAIVACAWGTFKLVLGGAPGLLNAPTGRLLSALFGPVWSAAAKALTVLGLLAGADLALTRFRFGQKMKMTKEEQRQEMKEDEGDPMLRARRKRKHRELSKANARAETLKADAVVVNPTHIAIAIRYRKDEGASPKVIAKGKGVLADVIRETARENGIPIVENIPLARLLYKKVKIGGSVPRETFKAVAAVLAFVYRLTGANKSGRAA